MNDPDRRTPPLDVELSRSVLTACRSNPDLARSINAILLRAARRLRARMADGVRLTVTGRVERIVLDIVLTAPQGCRVEGARDLSPDDAVDLTV